MEAIRGMMLNLIAIVFLTTLLDLLLPESSMRGYVKMTMGFFVMLTVLQPIMQWSDPAGMLQQWQLSVPSTAGESVAVQSDLYAQQSQQIEQLYQEKLNAQVRSLLLLSTDQTDITVHCTVTDRCLKEICIQMPTAEARDIDRVSQALSGYYGLEPEQIIITTEGGDPSCNGVK